MDFGFGINTSSTIELNRVDLSLYKALVKENPDALVCMSCGSCSATCMAASHSGMSIRKLLAALQRGQNVKPMLANCMLCGKCTMVCPRGINTRNLILSVCKISGAK